MKNKYIFAAMLLIALTIFSCLISILGNQMRSEKEDFLIVTSFYPTYIATLNVTEGIENVRVECLSQPSAGCVHDKQLTSHDMVLLENADVFIINGAGMESYLDSVISNYPDLNIADASKGISLLEEEDSHVHVHEEEAQTEKIYNAHVWMNMEKYSIQIGNIGNALCDADKEHAQQYRTNVEIYQSKVQEVWEEGRTLILASAKDAVSTHEAFSYFAENFQWNIADTINMDENTTLKPMEVSEVIEAVQQHEIPYVFTEEIYGSSLSRVLKKETKARTLVLDTLVLGDIDKDAYLKGMRKNIETLKEAEGQ